MKGRISYTLTVSDDKTYILLEISGEISRESVLEPAIKAHILSHDLGIDNIFVDVTEAVNLDTISNDYGFAYEDLRKAPGANLNARIAVLVRPDDHSHDFVETTMRNAGFDFKIFRDRGRALDYLVKKSPLW